MKRIAQIVPFVKRETKNHRHGAQWWYSSISFIHTYAYTCIYLHTNKWYMENKGEINISELPKFIFNLPIDEFYKRR